LPGAALMFVYAITDAAFKHHKIDFLPTGFVSRTETSLTLNPCLFFSPGFSETS